MHVNSKGDWQIFYKSENSEPWLCLRLLFEDKIRNLSKNSLVWATQLPSGVKIKFDPSLERSWCELFNIINGHGPKNPPKRCSWVSFLSPPKFQFHKMKLGEVFRPYLTRSLLESAMLNLRMIFFLLRFFWEPAVVNFSCLLKSFRCKIAVTLFLELAQKY